MCFSKYSWKKNADRISIVSLFILDKNKFINRMYHMIENNFSNFFPLLSNNSNRRTTGEFNLVL